jgi:subtilisin family serine protease
MKNEEVIFMPEHFEERFTLLYRSVPKPERVVEAGGTVQYVGKYIPAVSASFRSPGDAERLRNDPELVEIAEDLPLSLPYYRVEKIVPAAQGLLYKKKVTQQILPWNISKVIGKKRIHNGLGVRVGVLDTGINITHPDLAANVKGGVNFVKPFTSPNDLNGHGTHIAGIIGALNNRIGVVGVAPRVSLYAIKVLDSFGTGAMSYLIRGIEWGIANRMHILNISISAGKMIPSTLARVVAAAAGRGILVVAAAGNAGTPSGKGDTVEAPARISNAISVAALNKSNARESYSATGKVDIAAPGGSIVSTYSWGRYAVLSGTSMAAAHVSGVLALYRSLYPKASASTLKKILFSRAIDLPPAGKDPWSGTGLVQAR